MGGSVLCRRRVFCEGDSEQLAYGSDRWVVGGVFGRMRELRSSWLAETSENGQWWGSVCTEGREKGRYERYKPTCGIPAGGDRIRSSPGIGVRFVGELMDGHGE